MEELVGSKGTVTAQQLWQSTQEVVGGLERWIQLSRLLCILILVTLVSLKQYYFQLIEVSSSPLFMMTTSNKKDFFFSISNQAEKRYVYIPKCWPYSIEQGSGEGQEQSPGNGALEFTHRLCHTLLITGEKFLWQAVLCVRDITKEWWAKIGYSGLLLPDNSRNHWDEVSFPFPASICVSEVRISQTAANWTSSKCPRANK